MHIHAIAQGRPEDNQVEFLQGPHGIVNPSKNLVLNNIRRFTQMPNGLCLTRPHLTADADLCHRFTQNLVEKKQVSNILPMVYMEHLLTLSFEILCAFFKSPTAIVCIFEAVFFPINKHCAHRCPSICLCFCYNSIHCELLETINPHNVVQVFRFLSLYKIAPF